MIATLIDGRWIITNMPSAPERTNFLIVCDYGDWSGFRTLAECLLQVPSWQHRAPGFYRIEER